MGSKQFSVNPLSSQKIEDRGCSVVAPATSGVLA
jgi:hypothetical protein